MAYATGELDPIGVQQQLGTSDVAMFNFFSNVFGGKDDEDKMGRWVPGKKKVANCTVCDNSGQLKCPGCNGKGRSKTNGNIMERYKCMVCQGFGIVPCNNCDRGGRGFTPEQTGER